MKKIKYKKALYYVVIGTLTLLVIIYSGDLFKPQNSISINEVAFLQSDGVDWIELYNSSPHNITLQKMFLSDDPEDLTKYEIEKGTNILARGFIVIYTDNYKQDKARQNTNFNISYGETIYLTETNGETIIDTLEIVSNNTDYENRTIGRYPDGSDDVYLLNEPTLSMKNYSPFDTGAVDE